MSEFKDFYHVYVGGAELSQTNAFIRKYDYVDSSTFWRWHTIIMWDEGSWRNLIDYDTPDEAKRDYDFDNLIHGIINHGSTLGQIINEPAPDFQDHKIGGSRL